jgi:sterol desaturase/sphingolipid hydroxylase (fatty acid hydroxylase superfamily)
MELLALRSLAVSLLGEDLAMFWTRTPSEWPFFGLPAFSLAILVSLELISFLVFLALELATPAKSYVNPGGRLIQRRDCADFSCIWINKLATVPFMLHMMKDLHLAPQPLPSSTLASVLLPVPLLFLAYDAMYSPFHYFLHWPGVYPYIHKHHHRQVAPHRGLDDAVNTHPIEYVSAGVRQALHFCTAPSYATQQASSLIPPFPLPPFSPPTPSSSNAGHWHVDAPFRAVGAAGPCGPTH